MDLVDQMATFVDIVEAGSLSAAARRRRLSLAAVSRQLGALEAELGASLILRTTRAMTVTDAGRQFYEHALRALHDIDAARASVRGAGGVLRVSAPVTIGLTHLVPLLPALHAAHPSLVVELRLEDHAADLIAEGIDVAIRAGVALPDSTSVVARELMRFSKWVVAAPRYLRAHGTPRTPEALGKHAAIVQLVGEVERWTLRDAAGTESTLRVRGPLRCTAPAAIRDLAIAGAGLALLPDLLVRDDIAAGRLRRVLPDHASPPLTLWAVHRVELRDAPRVRVFVDHVRRALAR